MADMEELILKAKDRGISIIMDLVLNHCSDQHAWFLEAKKGKNNPYHDYFIWRDGEPGVYPTDMRATFGGPAWTYVPELKQYIFLTSGKIGYTDTRFRMKKTMSRTSTDGYTSQGMDADSNYIYIPLSPGGDHHDNLIHVYSTKTGKFLGEIQILTGMESETIFHVGNQLYVVFNNNGAKIAELSFTVKD